MYKIKNADFVCAAVEANPFPDSVFNVIIIKDLQEHIPEDYLVLSEAPRLMKSDGLLIIYVPHELHGSLSFESIIQYLFNYNIDKAVGHVRRYDLNEIPKLLSENNFEIKYHTYFGHFLFAIISIIGVNVEELMQSKTKSNTENNSKFVELIKKYIGSCLFIVARSIKNREDAR